MLRSPSPALRAAALALLLSPAAARAAALTLDEAIAAALQRNEVARAAEEQVRAAEARVAAARSAFFPDLALAGSYARSSGDLRAGADEGGPAAAGALTGTATLSLPLFDARTFPLHRQARLDRDGARAGADDARQVLAFDVAAAFVGALSAEQVLAAAERRLQLARATEEDARSRATAGLVGSNDVTRAEVERWSAERDLTRVRTALETARVQLAALVDAPVAGLALAAPEPLLAAADRALGEEDALAAEALGRRRDLRALALRADALRAFADEPPARLVPSLALTGQLRARRDDGADAFQTDALVGATLTWALWDGGLRAAERRERLALASAADLARQGAARGARRDVESALASLRGAQAASRQAGSAVGAARRNADESALLYRQGLAPALAVTDANGRLFQAEVDLARARFDVATAFLALRRATGLDPLGRELP